MYPGNWSKQADRIQLVEKNRLGRTAKLDEQEEYGAVVRSGSAAGSTKSGRYMYEYAHKGKLTDLQTGKNIGLQILKRRNAGRGALHALACPCRRGSRHAAAWEILRISAPPGGGKRGQGAGSLRGTGAVPRPSESPGKVCCAHLHTGYLYDAWKCATITVREQQPGGSGA